MLKANTHTVSDVTESIFNCINFKLCCWGYKIQFQSSQHRYHHRHY